MNQRQRPNRRTSFLPQIIFLILTFVTAVSGVYVALRLFGFESDSTETPEIITIEIIITATPAPTPLGNVAQPSNPGGQVNLPSEIAADVIGAVSTIDADRIGAVDVILLTPTPESAGDFLPDNCLLHVMQSGDTPFGVADRYGADRNLLLLANNLTVETSVRLQIGDELIVPLEGCNISGATGENPAFAAAIATLDPNIIDIELVAYEGLGDITSEVIRLRNNGAQLNITDWTLSDSSGNSYVFPELLLFNDAEINLYTRSGRSTGYALFWGKDASVWQQGEQLTLSDAGGQVRATLILSL